MKTSEQFRKEGEILKKLRKTIKIKQIVIAKMFNMNQGNYCNLEKGLCNSSKKFNEIYPVLLNKFHIYKTKRIIELKKEIAYLETFVESEINDK